MPMSISISKFPAGSVADLLPHFEIGKATANTNLISDFALDTFPEN